MGVFGRRGGVRIVVDPHLVDDLPLVARAHRGQVDPLSQRLAGLRQDGRWEHRDLLVQHASRCPPEAPWLRSWQTARPEDPDAAVIRAQLLVVAAWEVRTTQRAVHVSAERFDRFFELLRAADPWLHDVVHRWPGDPSAWTPLLVQVRGLELGRDRLLELAHEAARRAPSGFGWRRSVTDSLSAWWSGSLNASWEYAVDSAVAHPHSRLVLLPLFAAARGHSREATHASVAMIDEALPEAWRYVQDSGADAVEQVRCATLVICWLLTASRDRDARLFLEGFLLRDGVVTLDGEAWRSSFNVGPAELIGPLVAPR